jgi:putative peptidoglycan lipid II flippase
VSSSDRSRTGFSLRSIGPVAALLSGAAVLGQVFGLGRELYIASRVGTSPELDALLVAAVLPTLLGSLLASATSTAIVPAYVALAHRDGDAAAQQLAGALITWISLAALIGMIVLVASAPQAVMLSGPGLAPDTSQTAASFVPLLAPIALFSALMGLLSAVCQIHDRFQPISAAWVSGPIFSFAATILLWDALGISAVAVGLTLAAAAPSSIVFAYALRAGILPPLTLRFDREPMTAFLRHASPLVASSVIGQFNVLIDRAVASILPVGAVSTLRYGEVIIRSPVQALVPAWTTVAYPALVRASTDESEGELSAGVNRSLRYIAVVFVPLTIAIIAFAPLVVEAMYERGAFDRADTVATALVVAAFAPVLLIMMVHSVFVGTLNAHRRGVVLLVNASVRIVLNAILNVAFGLAIGVAGIALSTSVTSTLLLIWLGWNVRRVEPNFLPGPFVALLSRAAFASAIPGIPIALWVWSGGPAGSTFAALGTLIVLTLIGAGGYIASGWLLRLEELRTIVRFAWARLAGLTMRGT